MSLASMSFAMGASAFGMSCHENQAIRASMYAAAKRNACASGDSFECRVWICRA